MKDRQSDQKPVRTSSRLRLWGVLAGGPLALALAATLWVQPGVNPGEASPPSTAPALSRSDSRHPAPTRVELAYHWKVGDVLTYQVRSHTTIRIEEKGWQTGGSGNSTEISGLCSYLVLAVESDRITVAAQRSQTTVLCDQRPQTALTELLDAEPVLLLMDHEGRRLDCLLPRHLPTADRELLAGLHEHHLALPGKGGSSRWITTERGRAGEFACTHQVTRTGAIEKRRGGDSARSGCEILQSDIVATIGDTWLEIFDARESFAISNAGKRIGVVEARFHMSRTDPADLPDALVQLASDVDVLASFTPQHSPGTDQDSAIARQSQLSVAERYAAVTFDEITAQLRNAVDSADKHADTIEAIHALRDWLLVHPEQAFPLADSLADSALPGAFTARAIHSLELAGKRPEAQQALAGLLLRPEEFPRTAILQAVIAAGGVGTLRPELHAALSETINRAVSSGDFSVSDAALYALGNLAQSNPLVAEQLSEALLPDLAAANHARTTQTALNTLANGRLATPEIVHQATQLAQAHPEADVRAAAVHYLSRLPDTSAATLVPFLRDSAEAVQLESIESLALRLPAQPELATTLEQHLAASTSDLITSRLNEILKN